VIRQRREDEAGKAAHQRHRRQRLPPPDTEPLGDNGEGGLVEDTGHRQADPDPDQIEEEKVVDLRALSRAVFVLVASGGDNAPMTARQDQLDGVAQAWDVEYAAGRYRDEPPLPFVADVLSAVREHDLLGAEGLYVGCGNGRNYLPLVQAGLDLVGLDSRRRRSPGSPSGRPSAGRA
jgi:hypothetical protein